MKSHLTETLRCPQCGSSLSCTPYKSICTNEIIDGLLRCPCGEIYIIYRGVPQLLSDVAPPQDFIESYNHSIRQDAPLLLTGQKNNSPNQFSFSYQWSLHSYDALTWELFLSERVEIFFRYFGIPREMAPGMKLLDACCGNGTLSAALAQQGLEVFAMDYSTSVYRAFENHLLASSVTVETLRRLHYIQGDVLHPPFQDGYFDLIYSDGVLHHTSNTKMSFMSLARKVKPGGQLFVWLYRSDNKSVARIKLAVVKIGRKVLHNLSHKQKLGICYVGAAILIARLRLLSIFGYKPRRITHHMRRLEDEATLAPLLSLQ